MVKVDAAASLAPEVGIAGRGYLQMQPLHRNEPVLVSTRSEFSQDVVKFGVG